MNKKDLESICNISYYILSIIAYSFLFGIVMLLTHIPSFTWLFFIVTFVIPFVLVHLPFLMEKKWKFEIITSIIISLVYLLIFVPVLEYGIIKYSSSFSSNKWKNHSELRYLMISDLENKHEIIGMDKEQIYDLLGKADYTLESDFCYYVNNEVDFQYYCLTFKNDKVIETFNNNRV